MVGATSPCILCHSSPEDVDAINFCNTCTLSSGGASRCAACQDYIALEAQISATKQALDDLLSQRPKMRTRVNQNHDLFTRRVPLEIVYSVFQFCVPEKWSFDSLNNDTNTESTGSRMLSPPLLLGGICRTWRNIAWGMKPLWTLFTINLARLGNPNDVALAREWLDRAGQLRLSISIHITHVITSPIVTPQFEIATQIFALVNERSEQWECLEIVDAFGWTTQLTGGSRGAPNLQALKFCDDRITGFSLAGPKPQPSQLSLHECALDSIDIEYNRLTHVYLSELYLDECVEVLRRAPALVYCKFNFVYPDNDQFPIHDEPIVRPNLEFLEFDCPDYKDSQAEEIIIFFKSFIFPNLKHLKLNNGGFWDYRSSDISWDPVITHIVNASPPLISLAILLYEGQDPIRQSIIPILRRTPFLRDLEMFAPFDEEWEGEQNEFFKLLANSSLVDDRTETSFLPNLQSIKFHLYSEEEGRDKFWDSVSGIFGPIADIHNPRRRPLKTLRVRTKEIVDLSKDALLQLLRLQQEGIVLDLKDIDEEVDLIQRSTELHDLRQWSNGDPQVHLT